MLFVRFSIFSLCLGLFLTASCEIQGQLADLDVLSDEEAKQVKIAERFLSVLEKSPRRGTALDRVHGHHVEFGTLDDFLEQLKQRIEKNPEDGTGWMLLGLFESQRGEDADAVEAFRKAEKYRPDDALPSYYLGQALLLIGLPEEAVEAFETATERNPRRADLLEIYRQLGRVHQRAQRTEHALDVWNRLEELFPDDPRVQEQIAVTLVEEGEYALALPRYERLTKLVKDDYRRVMYKIEAAELKIRENRREEGLADFETLIGDLNPQGWLHRDVRRRIEEVFLKMGDQDGLVNYYEKWIEKHPEDVGGMARLAKFLASSARVPEAIDWMEKAIKLSPSHAELRKSFIDQLVDDGRYAEAVNQYALLSESAPGNQDYLRDWGRLVLKDKQVDLEKRRKEATRIWNMIVEDRPDDALTTAQVADLFRHAEMSEPAIALYQKAIELSPGDPQYREYLGEYYHVLKRPEEAMEIWKTITEGERHNVANVARLAEVYNSFGYLEHAVEKIAEACKLDAKDFGLHVKASEYHSRASKYDEALEYILTADKLATNDEEREAVIVQRVEIFQSSRRLEDEIDRLVALSDNKQKFTTHEWYLLARYFEADRRWAEAIDAVDKVLAEDAKSIPALTTAARIAELSGNYAKAVEDNKKLAEVDRRARGDHLMNIARLQVQLGQGEDALATGRDLIVSAPGNTDHYEFYSQLCFQLGKTEQGLDALRKAVRINPNEPHLIMSLGSSLSQQFRSDEAIEVYWQAFEKTDELDDKTGLTMKLAELYLQLNQFDKLIERFERDRRQESKRREMTICLAQAHHSSGDYGTARMELESLLSEDTRDTNLLQQLSKLSEEGSDLDSAIDYQRQLISIAPGHETEFRLAKLLEMRGDRDEASEILVQLTRREENPGRLLRSLDSLLRQGSFESVIAVTDPLLSEQKDDWELLYREGVAWASLENSSEARDRFERLLALPIPHENLGISAKEKFKQAQAKAKSNNLRGIRTTMPKQQSPLAMLSKSHEVQRAVGLDQDPFYGGRGPQPVWTPDAFGTARMACYGWLLKLEQDHQMAGEETDAAEESFVEEISRQALEEGADREKMYDFMYIEQVRNNFSSIFEIAKRLAQDGAREEQQFFLNSLRSREMDAQSAESRRYSGQQAPEKTPLKDEEIELMMTCFEEVSKAVESEEDAAIAGGQITYASNGQAYLNVGGQWIPIGGGRTALGLGIVVTELKLAGQEERATQLLEEEIAAAESTQRLSSVMNILFEQEELERLPELYNRWIDAAVEELAEQPTPTTGRRSSRHSRQMGRLSRGSHFFVRWMGKIGAEEQNLEVLSIMDRSLDLAVEEAKQRRKQKKPRGRRGSTQSYGGTNFTLYYGKENIYTRLDYPNSNQYVDNSALMVLREAFEVLKRNDVMSDLTDHLRGRVTQASAESPENLVYEQLMLAYVLWWQEEQEEAIELLATASSQLQDDPSFRLEVASLRITLGDIDDALEIVEAISPRDQKLVQQRELMALELAERLGDVDRARMAAERLFGLRLDNDTQLQLVERMRRLGLVEMAEAIVARVHRRSGSKTASLSTLMTLYQSQGKVELAQQIAHTILRRSTSPLAAMANSSRNPFRYEARRRWQPYPSNPNALSDRCLEISHSAYGRTIGAFARFGATLCSID